MFVIVSEIMCRGPPNCTCVDGRLLGAKISLSGEFRARNSPNLGARACKRTLHDIFAPSFASRSNFNTNWICLAVPTPIVVPNVEKMRPKLLVPNVVFGCAKFG